ncbi:MAG: cell division protein FtsX [Rhizomicrobium sp.]
MNRSPARFLPREKGAAPLDVMIGIMAFLAALALGASLLADRASLGWRAGLSDRLTVQILVPAHGDAVSELARETAAALSVLRATPGIAHAAPLSEDEMQSLVEPWLGKGSLVAELPLPKLIDAAVTPGAHVDLVTLGAQLKKAAPDSQLDDHSRWMARLKGLSDTISYTAYGILILIAVATAATVTFATRAGLAAHHEMVALLHQMGARSGFIARGFEQHFALTTFGASAFGTVLAALLFLAAGGLEFVGVEAVPFLPPIALKLSEVAWFAAVPAAAASIAWATARLSVLSVVRRIY